MYIFILILRIIFGAFFCYAGFMHFKKPQFYKNFIPNFLPKKLINIVFGIIELILGLGMFFTITLKHASLGILILLIIFLPIHIWDLTKEQPAIGSKKSAIIRILVQFILMYGIYFVYIHL